MSWSRCLPIEDGTGPNWTSFGKRMRSPNNKNHHHNDFFNDVRSQPHQNQVDGDNNEQSPWQAMKRLRVAENSNDERNFPMLPQRATESGFMAVDVPARTLFPPTNESSFNHKSHIQFTENNNAGSGQHRNSQPEFRYETINQLLGSLHNQRVHRDHPQISTDGMKNGNMNFEHSHLYSVQQSGQKMDSSNIYNQQFQQQQKQLQYSIPPYQEMPNPVWSHKQVPFNGMGQTQQRQNDLIPEQGLQQHHHPPHNESSSAQDALHDRKRKVIRLFTNSKLG